MSLSPQRENHIDGLRSLAIVPVVLFHAGWSALPGGFVGVDIFFVISGYLITRILDTEIAAGAFSLWRFYERRARRIMPALFLVLAVSAIIAATILLPGDLVLFGRSLIYTTLFASNLYFYANTGYFDAEADSYALLHTWSLAVEEQFYLLFPLVLLASARLFGKGRVWVVAAICAGSFAASVVLSPIDESFAFYLPLTRAWELMLGALLALNAVPAPGSRPLREAVSALALAAILATILFLDPRWPFPGWIAAIPVLGAAALIRYSPGTLVGRLLSLRLLVGIGLISYSLYLWHWPLLVFAADWLMRPLAVWEGTALSLLAAGLSILTWKFVEQPFRDRAFLTRRGIFALTGGGVVAASILGALFIGTSGFPQRLPAEAVRLEAFARDSSPQRGACHGRPIGKACVFGADVEPTIAVWGDSHAVELAYALGELAGQSGRSVMQITRSSCAPVARTTPRTNAACVQFNNQVLAGLEDRPGVDTVILAMSIGTYDDRDLVNFLAGLRKTVRTLRAAGKTVALLLPDPAAPWPVPQQLALSEWRSGAFVPEMYALGSFQQDHARSYRVMRGIAADTGATPIDPTSIYCPDGTCLAYRDGVALFFDNHHPSLSGARLLAPLFADVIARSGSP